MKPSPLHLFALSAALALASPLRANPVLYNNRAGDGSADLDRAIREAYGSQYAIVDTSAAAGFTDPMPVEGDIPHYVKDERGQIIGGYVLVVYIVGADGAVASPVIVKGVDERLCKVALSAMADWKFKPARLKGAAVASTAAQEFNFGPLITEDGFRLESVTEYQPQSDIAKRLPPNGRVRQYISDMTEVAHHFFVNDSRPETVYIVIVTRPGGRERIWLMPSMRQPAELEPLKRLLEAVKPLDVTGGPVILCLTGVIAGGDGSSKALGEYYRNPIPAPWRQFAKAMKDPPPFSSDAFLNAYWP